MNPHALRVLEYKDLLTYLALYTESEITKSKIAGIHPSTNYKEIRHWSDELTEYRYLISSGQQIPAFSGPSISILGSLEASATEGWRLPPEKISAVGQLLMQSELIREGFLDLQGIPLLKARVNKLVLLPELLNMITRSVNEKGEVLDRASDELAKIRRSLRKHLERIRSRMEELAASLYKKGVLQDPIVTMREGRYVLPVRAGASRDVPGTVLDRSSSGATFFIEPKVSMPDSVALGKLEAEERQEVNRILLELTAAIGLKSDELVDNLEIVVEMDFIRAKARFCNELKANSIPILPDPLIDLKECRNPLLLFHRLSSLNPDDRSKPVVPIDLELNGDNCILVITGPNTGGKTVALKTIGITILMVQSGLHPVCSEYSRVGVFKNIFADIGDEQSLQQSLSTFSSHVKQIVEIIENADSNALVLLDELGAGTDPEEGSALGIAIIAEMLRKKVITVANTHHNSIKAFAFTTPGIENAAMEFDIQSLQPTFRILMGRIGQSNAFAIASRLGFPTFILEEAQRHLSGKSDDLQKMLDLVEERRIMAEKRIVQASNEKSRAKELRRAREDVLKRAEDDARHVLEKATRESQSIISELLRERDELKRELKKIRDHSGFSLDHPESRLDLRRQKDNLAELTHKLSEMKDSFESDKESDIEGGIPGPGDIVRVKRFGSEGRVIELSADNRLLVELSGKKMRIPLDGVVKLKKSSRKDENAAVKSGMHFNRVEVEYLHTEPPPLRLNLVGKKVDEAIDEMNRYMDRVIRARLPQVTIVHGLGTGKLQNAVVAYLKRVPQVLRARSGYAVEGGGGVTVVEMDISE
ncbi:endonuclease MutS2 [bacterium]|nr:endonuclease MutS2 [candidate division CSSED10-310 bacterium]